MNLKFKIIYVLIFAMLAGTVACRKYHEKIIGHWTLQTIMYYQNGKLREVINANYLRFEFLPDKTFYRTDVDWVTKDTVSHERGHWKISKKNLELNFDNGRITNYEIKKLKEDELEIHYIDMNATEIYKKTN